MNQPACLPDRRLRYRLSPVELKGSVLLLAVGVPLAMAALLFMLPGDAGRQALEETFAEIPATLWLALPLAIVGSLALFDFYRRQARAAWLEIGDTGIRCRPPAHHGRRFWTRHEWQVDWKEIESATLYRPDANCNEPQHWVNTTLALETATGSFRIGLLHWDCASNPPERPGLLDGRKTGAKFDALMCQHPLMQALQHRQVELKRKTTGWAAFRQLSRQTRQQQNEAETAGHVDLLTYPSAQVILGLMLLAGVLALFHFMLLPPVRPLWTAPIASALLVGVVSGIGAWQLTRRMPARERTALSAMLAIVIALCWHPLGVRTEILLNGEAKAVVYAVEDRGLFYPIDSRYPVLDLSDLNVGEFFDSLETGSEFEFMLIRVGHERYALSLAELFEQTRAFYGTQD